MSGQKFSLKELNEQIRLIIALNFPQEIWVNGEIAQINERKGITYIQLVEKEAQDGQITAQASAIIWRNDLYKIKAELGRSLDSILQPGNKVMLLTGVTFEERYGLTLIVKGVELNYTLGVMEQEKQGVIQELTENGWLEKNKKVPFPKVLQRIALFSSPSAAGYQDFIHQLQENPFNYAFQLKLFPIALQGRDVEKELLIQIKKMENEKIRFDCAVLIRGGGSKLDLAGFDKLEIGKAIAHCSIPVLTGIGHETDQSVADLVAHTPLKTPTAVAEFLIRHNFEFEQSLLKLGHWIKATVKSRLDWHKLELRDLKKSLLFSGLQVLKSKNFRINLLADQLKAAVVQKIQVSKKELEHLDQLIKLIGVEATLKRGFTLTQKEGKIIVSVNSLKKGDTIVTLFSDGSQLSKIE